MSKKGSIQGDARGAILVVTTIAGLVFVCRSLGFGEGVLLGATPASGVALAAALFMRWRGAAAAALGFGLGSLISGTTIEIAVVTSISHGLAALAGWLTMRTLARKGATATRTLEWLVFLAGVCVFAIVVASSFALVASLGLLSAFEGPFQLGALAFVFETLGIATACTVLATLGENRRIWDDPGPAIGIATLAVVLLAMLGLLLGLDHDSLNPSGLTMLVALPFCLWIAMQHRSLDGAVISFVTVNVALLMVLRETGTVVQVEFVKTIVFLNLLVLVCQLVHAINLDRLAALAENEAHRRNLEENVAERTARLTEMTQRAVEADVAKTRFLATVAHEVRTPLTGVIGMTSVVLSSALDEDTRRNVGVIRSSGFHLLTVINRILDYSRLEQGEYLDEEIEFDLRNLISEVIEEARFSTNSEVVILRADIPRSVRSRRFGNRQALRQIVTNLIGNAVKFTDRGTITVRARDVADDVLRLEVEDTGIGVPSAAQQRIFQPFEQGDGSMTRRYGGTGLGLSISAEMIRRMGGRIGLESAEGEGSTFWIEAPMALSRETRTPKLTGEESTTIV